MTVEELKELTFNELKKEAKRLNVEINKYDNKEVLLDKLSARLKRENKTRGNLKSVRDKFKETKKVVVSKANPNDTRDSIIVQITNATGSYHFPVKFNVAMHLPIPVIKNLKAREFQSWKTVNKGILGNVDVPEMLPAFIVQEVNE